MSFDDLAANHESRSPIGRGGLCARELLDVPYDGQLDDGDF